MPDPEPKEVPIIAPAPAPIPAPVIDPEIQDIIESTDENEIDLTSAIVKAYNLGSKHAKKRIEKNKDIKKTEPKIKSCFWCGFDRTCTTCRTEDRENKS